MIESIRGLLERLLQLRFAKFGLVGASGMLVNMAVLYLAQEYLFSHVESTHERLQISLALAILIATLSNFIWNRLWTWADRHVVAEPAPMSELVRLFGKYALASWLGSALQYGLTLWLAHYMHYLVANVVAIVIASVSNFIANDRWTFRKPR